MTLFPDIKRTICSAAAASVLLWPVSGRAQAPQPQTPPAQTTPAQTAIDNTEKAVQSAIAAPQKAVQAAASLPSKVGDTLSAKPLSSEDKFDYRIVQSFGARGFVGAALGAAVGQARDVPHEWGEGVEGYAIRYGSSFGTNLARQSMEFALETAFHEDPRYFPSREAGFKARLKNVLIQTVVARKDSGGETFAWARMVSAFGTGQLVNAWQPESTGSVKDGFVRGAIILAGDAGYNFLQEFFPIVRPRSLKH